MRRLASALTFGLLAACGGDGGGPAGPAPTPTAVVDPASAGWGLLRGLEHLDQPQAGRARMFSSASRDLGSNEDYNNFLRAEGRNTFVLAEHEGPGVVTRIWMTARVATAADSVPGFQRSATMSVYTDGEAAPLFTVPLYQFFRGDLWPFVWPLVAEHRGRGGRDGKGFYSYVPISFAKSVKITVTDPLPRETGLLTDRFFYQINLLDLSGSSSPVEPSPVRQPDGSLALSELDRKAFDEMTAQWQAPGTLAARMDAARERRVFAGPLDGRAVVADLDGPGRILGIRLRAGTVRPAALERIRLRVFWDDEPEPAIDVPLATTWGNYFERAPFVSKAQGADADGTLWLRLPMPFRQAARVELLNDGAAQPIAAEVYFDPGPVRDDARYLHAAFAAATVDALQLHSMARVSGTGHLVAVRAVVDVRADHNALEGDEFITVDGAMTHRGTGTEDLFNAHWFWEGGVRSAALHGATSVQGRTLPRPDAFRFFVPDRVPFESELRFDLENGNRRGQKDGYRTVVFYYLAH
jgi:hypothetical protein